jgi:hypothetical protein
VSQSVELTVAVVGMTELIRAIVEAGLRHEQRSEYRAEDGRTHAVDLVVSDEQGAQVGVKVDSKTGLATFVGHDGKDERASALARRVAQRYAYSKTLDELKRKGYQITTQETQKDGTIKLVAQRWR